MTGIDLDHGSGADVAVDRRDADDAVALLVREREARNLTFEHDRLVNSFDVQIEEVAHPQSTARVHGDYDVLLNVLGAQAGVDSVGQELGMQKQTNLGVARAHERKRCTHARVQLRGTKAVEGHHAVDGEGAAKAVAVAQHHADSTGDLPHLLAIIWGWVPRCAHTDEAKVPRRPVAHDEHLARP